MLAELRVSRGHEGRTKSGYEGLERGTPTLGEEDIDRLAEAANDARVVIDNFQTGGVTPTPIGRAMTATGGLSGIFDSQDLRARLLPGGSSTAGESSPPAVAIPARTMETLRHDATAPD